MGNVRRREGAGIAKSSTNEALAESYTTAAICAEYARPRDVGETLAGRWHRVLRHDAPRLAATMQR